MTIRFRACVKPAKMGGLLRRYHLCGLYIAGVSLSSNAPIIRRRLKMNRIPGFHMVSAVVVLSFLPAIAKAQQDEKDLLIEQQKQTIARLKQEIELLVKTV